MKPTRLDKSLKHIRFRRSSDSLVSIAARDARRRTDAVDRVETRVQRVMDAYKRQFAQQSVLRLVTTAWASF
jgi:hypothetical protein